MIEGTIYDIPLNNGQKKLFFLEEKHAKTKPKMRVHKSPTVSINRKYNFIVFSADAIEALELDHSFLKFYFDKLNRTIGFRVKKSLESGEKVSQDGWRYLAKNKHGVIREGIAKILNEIQAMRDEVVYKKLQIHKYKDYQSGYKEETYYYVIVKPS